MDKNLGISVRDLSWYDYQIYRMLNNRNTYSIVPYPEGLNFFDVERCVEFYQNKLAGLQPNYKSVVKILLAPTTTQLPMFHGILKLHKSFIKPRRIVPNTNWSTKRLLKILNKSLKPHPTRYSWLFIQSQKVVFKIEKIR